MEVFSSIAEIKLDFDLLVNTSPILHLLPSPPPSPTHSLLSACLYRCHIALYTIFSRLHTLFRLLS